ncbi:MAG: ribonuclease III [Christensenellaceae bacterium]
MQTERIESLIGYTFRNKELLSIALTHSSYSNEHGGENYERLEFLGDAIVQLVVSERLYHMGGNEGVMTVRRQQIVSADPLEEAVRRLGLERYLLHTGGAENVGKKAISSIFESVTAAVYLDGGIQEAKKFVLSNLPVSAGGEINYKGELQERLQSHGSRPHYTLVEKRGEEHDPLFSVRVDADGVTAYGEGKSRRAAEQIAAREALALLKGKRQ